MTFDQIEHQSNDRYHNIMSELTVNHPPKYFTSEEDKTAMKDFNNQMKAVQQEYQSKEQGSLMMASKVRLC